VEFKQNNYNEFSNKSGGMPYTNIYTIFHSHSLSAHIFIISFISKPVQFMLIFMSVTLIKELLVINNFMILIHFEYILCRKSTRRRSPRCAFRLNNTKKGDFLLIPRGITVIFLKLNKILRRHLIDSIHAFKLSAHLYFPFTSLVQRQRRGFS